MVNFVMIGASSWELYLNKSKITIIEGKYPDDWIWELYINENYIEISVMKTVSFSLDLSDEDKFRMEFLGFLGDWTDFEDRGPFPQKTKINDQGQKIVRTGRPEEDEISISHDEKGWHLDCF